MVVHERQLDDVKYYIQLRKTCCIDMSVNLHFTIRKGFINIPELTYSHFK